MPLRRHDDGRDDGEERAGAEGGGGRPRPRRLRFEAAAAATDQSRRDEARRQRDPLDAGGQGLQGEPGPRQPPPLLGRRRLPHHLRRGRPGMGQFNRPFGDVPEPIPSHVGSFETCLYRYVVP